MSYFHIYGWHSGQTSGLTAEFGHAVTFPWDQNSANSEPGKGEWSWVHSLEPFGIIPRTHAANPSYQWGLFGESLFVMCPSPPLQTIHHPRVLVTTPASNSRLLQSGH